MLGRLLPWCLLLANALGASPKVPPKPVRFVTDYANALPAPRREALNETLAAFERETSNQVIVYVDRSLPADTTLEETSSAALREWGVGQKGRSNGVILFVFTDQRVMRIEVGYGLEGAIPDARARQITSDVIKPFFKNGDYAGGIEAGAAAILAAARGEAFTGTGKTVTEQRGTTSGFAVGDLVVVLGVLGGIAGVVLTAAFTKPAPPGPKPGAPFLGVMCLMLSTWTCAGFGFLSAGTMILGLLGVALCIRHIKRYEWGPENVGRRTASGGFFSSGSSGSSGSTSSDSSSSDSGSGSDFSGGGGDSGGGGSSDSW
jgi:uncharacterized protein